MPGCKVSPYFFIAGRTFCDYSGVFRSAFFGFGSNCPDIWYHLYNKPFKRRKQTFD